METEPNALRTTENESGSAKHENGTQRSPYRRKCVRERITRKRDPTPSLPPKMNMGTQNKKTGPDALGTAEKESGSAKKENRTRHPRYRRKQNPTPSHRRKQNPTPSLPQKTEPDTLAPPNTCPGAQNMKTGPDAVRTAEKVAVSAKHENGSGRHWYRRKCVRARKT
jgi:hypothetical protein